METQASKVDAPALPREPADDSAGLWVKDIPRELDPEWEEAFNWSYGPRLWNVGCG